MNNTIAMLLLTTFVSAGLYYLVLSTYIKNINSLLDSTIDSLNKVNKQIDGEDDETLAKARQLRERTERDSSNNNGGMV